MSPSDREVSQDREVPVPSPPCRDLEAAGRHSLALHRLGAHKAEGLPVPRSVLTHTAFRPRVQFTHSQWGPNVNTHIIYTRDTHTYP